MSVPVRLVTLLAVGSLGVGGAVVWANESGNDVSCADRSDTSAQQINTELTAAERARVAEIVSADPLVGKLLGGQTPREASSPNTPGTFFMFKNATIDRGQLGRSVMVTFTPTTPIGPGTYTWRQFNTTGRTDCPADGAASMSTQTYEGPAASPSPDGQILDTSKHFSAEVSLGAGRVIALQPDASDPDRTRLVGEPEILFSEK